MAKRVASRAKSAAGKAKVAVEEETPRVMRPAECRRHMQQTLAKEFKGIVEGFVEAAKTGSCPHVKLATELLKPEPKSAARKKGSAARFLEKFEKDRRTKGQVQ